MVTIYSQIPKGAGLSVTAYNQSTPTALGPQQAGTIQIAALTLTGDPINPFVVSEQALDCTYPAAPTVIEIVCGAAAGAYSVVIPFKCKVIAAQFNVNGTAPSNAGDTFALASTTLDTPATSTIFTAQTVNGAGAYGVVQATTINETGATLLSGDTLTCTTAKVGNFVGGSCYVTLLPVA